MELKHAVLQAMSRDELKAAILSFDLTNIDRRSADDMRTRLSRTPRASARSLLPHLSEIHVKAVCDALDISSKGRKRALIARLLAAEAAATPNSEPDSRPAMNEVPQPDAEREHSGTYLPNPPPGMVRVTKPELVWPGKYNDDGTLRETPRVALPFQVIEKVNESRAARDATIKAQPTLFDTYHGSEGTTFDEGWRNKLIWGDNLLVMESLQDKFAGKIDLIYIDPPFATGADFSFEAEIGDSAAAVEKMRTSIEEKAYRDTWGAGLSSFIDMIRVRIQQMRDLLAESGSIYVHCDWHVNALVRMAMDEVFGPENFLNQIAWYYRRWNIAGSMFARNHDTILFYAKKKGRHRFNQLYIPKSAKSSAQGKSWKSIIGEDGIRRSILTDEPTKGVPMPDMWDTSMINPVGHERTGYPTQKPEALLERAITASSVEGDLVADFFCGSGTTLAVAEKLGRRWLGCDLGRWGVHVSRKRLLDIKDCKPFEILNLGKYERQHWQGATFTKRRNTPLTERALYEYLTFILRLYGANPIPGLAHVHGRKGNALVHIGAVDAPVTIDDIQSAVEECVHLKAHELHVLGWEWEMGLGGRSDLRQGGLMQRVARDRGVKLRLLYIPREVMEQQAIDRGDVRFFELAYMDVKTERIRGKRRTVRLALQDFVIPSPELIPDEVRQKVNSWSDYIDYWAVDWDFRAR
ncbi:MAG: site-specific DNA-methyltransferase [Gammaproteobacteria bacterium]|nr:site-specific DNA-methyltransferase [Gammaproteobacteria bacterium]